MMKCKVDTYIDIAAREKAHVPPPAIYEIRGDMKLKSKCNRQDGHWDKEIRETEPMKIAKF